MHAMHDALRRECEHLARATARTDTDPRQLLRTAAGWELLKTSLHVHHTAEDNALWPALRTALAARPDDLALLEAEENHMSEPKKIALAGATGRLGSHVVRILKERGHEVVGISRSAGVDVVTGEGLADALAGVDL